MKRVLQVAAVVVIAVLAAQPALAGVTCGMLTVARTACVSPCGMAMSQMGMDCPMPEHVAGTGCLQECCRHGFPQGVVQSAGVKPKTGGTELIMVSPAMTPDASLSFAPARDFIIASAPPRYILLQVFRI
ncbi:MAG: hypothetical protein ABSG51_02210 [Terracidiphilus sp.]|jgi:hypothetical protein